MYTKNKSMDFCKTGVMKDYSVGKGSHDHPHGDVMKDTPDFSNPKVKENYKKSAELREHLKNKGITYNPETNKSTKRTSATKEQSAQAQQVKDDPGSKYDPSKDKE